KRKSESYVATYLNHFLEGESALSNEDRYRLGKSLIGTITLDDVNALAGQYYTDENRDILILAPDKDRDTLPGEETVNGWLAAVKAADIAPYDDNVQEMPLLDNPPTPGTVAE